MQLRRLVCFVAVVALLAGELTACASSWHMGMPTSNGNLAPYVMLQGDALRQYQADVVVCQKQIMAQYGDRYASNNAIIALRQCLISKGYVLLS
jgi:hypothetical protein